MKVSTNQTGDTIDRGICATRDIKSAKAKPITRSRFEQRFCGALLLLIFLTIVMVSVFLTHLSGRLVERLDGHVAIDMTAFKERPEWLQNEARRGVEFLDILCSVSDLDWTLLSPAALITDLSRRCREEAALFLLN